MKLINITSVTKNRIKEMIKTLIPEVGYIRITNRGSVVMKSSQWAFKRDILNITDVCISLLPHKIAEQIAEHDNRVEYNLQFNKYVSSIIFGKYFHYASFDIVDYLWKKFNQFVIIPIEVPVNSTTILERTDSIGHVLPETSSLSSNSKLYRVPKDLKKAMNSPVESEKNKLLKKINGITFAPKKKGATLVKLNLRWSPETIIRHLFYTSSV